ncbi:MAG: Fic family protein [Patescibacteria group bacterium]
MQTFKDCLQEIDRLYERYKSKRQLSKEEQEARYEKLRLEWTYNSNAIEGNSLTLGETAFYLREGLTSEGKPLVDYLEAKNHAEAIDWLFDVVRDKKPITEGFIKELNALLHKGISERPARGASDNIVMRKITPGAYKLQPNHVLTLSGEIHYYLEPLQVPGEMEKLIKMIAEQEETMRPVELASSVHYEITRIHPFDDCNGRVSRILLNLILIRAEYPPIVIKMEERRTYLESLEKADKGDKEPFYLFVAEHVKQSLQDK